MQKTKPKKNPKQTNKQTNTIANYGRMVNNDKKITVNFLVAEVNSLHTKTHSS